jgi:transposase InsO family protein
VAADGRAKQRAFLEWLDESLQEPVEEYARLLQMAKKRWKELTTRKKGKRDQLSGQDRQAELIRKAGVIESFLPRLQRGEHLRPNERDRAIKAMGVDSPQTFYNLAQKCIRQRRLFPQEPLVYALVKLSGRPRRELFTAEQELLIIGAYLFDEWQVLLPNGKVDASADRVGAEYIRSMLRFAYPDFEVTLRQIQDFLKESEREQHVLFALGREGLRAVLQEYMPKLPNSLAEPHVRWQSDARILPIIVYKQVGNKVIKFTVSLVIVIEEYSLRILSWCLVPRKTVSEIDPEELKNVDFTNGHVRLMLAGAMLDLNIRPHQWYTDRGSQFIAIRDFLAWLTDGYDPDHPIIPILGQPAWPWSRGKVEVVQKLIDACLRRLSGFVRDESDRMEWRRAYKDTDISLEDLEAVIREHVETWNATIVDGKLSRTQLSEQKPELLLPAPPKDRIAHFALAGNWGDVKIEDTGIPLPDQSYVPPMKSEEDFHRFMSKVGKRARYITIPRTSGNPFVLASLDGDPWEAVIPAKQVRPSSKRRAKNQWRAIEVEQRHLREYKSQFLSLCERLYGGVTMLSTSSEEVVPPRGNSGAGHGAGSSALHTDSQPAPPPATPPAPPARTQRGTAPEVAPGSGQAPSSAKPKVPDPEKSKELTDLIDKYLRE